MAKFLANENVPGLAVRAARLAGLDVAWVKEEAPGAPDETVLAMSLADDRVLATFDKDFGELAFRQGKTASCGVVLMRPTLKSPEYLCEFLVSVLSRDMDWKNNFCVAREGRLRVVPMPGKPKGK